MNRTTKHIVFILLFLLLISIVIFSQPVYAENRLIKPYMVYTIQNRASGKCLNVNYGTNANGTNVTQYTNDGSIEQKFRISYHSSVDAYRIFAMCSDGGSNRVLDVLRTGGSASGSIKSGNNVDIWARGDDACQLFEFKTIDIPNGYFAIVLKSNQNLALTSYGTGNGSGAGTSSTSAGNVYISTYTGASNQQWKFNKVAAPPAVPYRNYRGVSGQTYYIDSSCNGFTGHVNNAVNSWKSTITLSQASSNSSTSVDFFGVPSYHYDNDPTAPDDWIGHADTWISSTPENGLTRNWAYAIVNMNISEMNGSGLTSNQKAAAIAHEMGHGYGLLHYETSGTIMYPRINGMTVNTPSSQDRYAIDLKY